MRRISISRIRRLSSRDRIPDSEPRRYRATGGYMVLRWRVGPSTYVEALEHRVVMGMPADHLHVHHINGQRDDNRPENLAVLTAEEHHREHGAAWAEDAVTLYEGGMSTLDIAKVVGVDPSNVYRRLAARGVQFRTAAEWNRWGIDEAELARLAVEEGMHPGEIAQLYDIGREQVRRILAERKVKPHRPGRPSDEELTLRRARSVVHERSGGLCEAQAPTVCTGKAQHVHHTLLRSQGGTHEPAMLMDVCLACHNYIHAHPRIAYKHGWLVHREDAARLETR